MSHRNPSPTLAILYGLAEGSATSKHFRRALSAAGYTLVANPAQADVIIAHSGGYLYLPKHTQDKTVLLIAPSCGRRRKSLITTQGEKVWHDLRYSAKSNRLLSWSYKFTRSFIYLLTQPRRLIHMWRATIGSNAKLPELDSRRVIVITYPADPWSGYLPQSERNLHPTYLYIERDGVHDDIWLNPQTYISLITQLPQI